MQVTNGVIWEAKAPLAELVKERLPIKPAYWLAKLARQIGEQHALLEGLRSKLVLEYGEPDGKGNTIVRPESRNWRAFATAYEELMALPVEITVEKVKIPADGDIKASAATLLALEPFVEVV